MFLIVQNILLHFWKMLVYTCQIEILETLGSLMFTLEVERVPPLDTFRRQMSSAVIPIYSMDVRSELI